MKCANSKFSSEFHDQIGRVIMARTISQTLVDVSPMSPMVADVFQFISTCIPLMNEDEKREEVISFLRHSHNRASQDYRNSDAFRSILKSSTRKLEREKHSVYVFIDDIVTVLMQNKIIKKRKSSCDQGKTTVSKRCTLESVLVEQDNKDRASQRDHNCESSDRQSSPSKDLQTQQPADEGQTSTSPEQQHPPVAESTSSVTDERIIRLEHLLKRVEIIVEELSNSNETDSDNDERNPSMLDVEITQLLNSDSEKMKNLTDLWKINAPYNPCSDEIKRLQAHELTLEEMNDEDSCYIQCEGLKRKCMKIFENLCKLKKVPPSNGRVIESKIQLKSSRFPEINKKIQLYVNKAGFPDFFAVHFLVKQANKQHNLRLNHTEVERIARRCFEDAGKKLQDRRQRDFLHNWGCYLTDGEHPDPARIDVELKTKLQRNSESAKKAMDEVFQKFEDLQDVEQSAHSSNRNDADDNGGVSDSEIDVDADPPSEDDVADSDEEEEEESGHDGDDDIIEIPG